MTERISIVENILGLNDQQAIRNRQLLDNAGIFSVNIMASPGAGKTSLIELTIKNLMKEFSVAVIDGDLASSLDADRASKAGAKAIQINTGGECHLDANMVQAAFQDLELNTTDLMIVENVGNLVCPISFQLGTHSNVLIASVPEGDDKPYKYPGMYRGVDVLLINKIDLLPYLSFDLDYFNKGVSILNPGIQTFSLSCRTGEGLEPWINWLRSKLRQTAHPG
jgi:hydrogenase nickel incorporation protein HypB